MSERHDEPAFPCHTNGLDVCGVEGHEAMIPILNGGMSKREAFALGAMIGLLAGGEWHDSKTKTPAIQAVENADELITALKETP